MKLVKQKIRYHARAQINKIIFESLITSICRKQFGILNETWQQTGYKIQKNINGTN